MAGGLVQGLAPLHQPGVAPRRLEQGGALAGVDPGYLPSTGIVV